MVPEEILEIRKGGSSAQEQLGGGLGHLDGGQIFPAIFEGWGFEIISRNVWGQAR